MAGLRSAFGENIKRAMINLGARDTSKLGKFGSYIDQDTIQKAIANKYSANAQIQQGQDTQQAQMEAGLAARGTLSSGQATKSTGDIAADAEKSRFDALQQFLTSGEQGLTGLADEEYNLGKTVAAARANAADRASKYDLAWLDYEGAANAADAGVTPPGMVETVPQAPTVTNPYVLPKPKAPVKVPPLPFHTDTFPNKAGKVLVKPAVKKK